jgi:hypothetical protein
MSVYWDILQAVEASVDAVSGVPATEVRYDLEAFQGDPCPLVIIAPGPEGEKHTKLIMPNGVWYEYPVLVALVTPGNRKSASGLEAYLQLRQDVRNKLFAVKLAGVSEVFDTGMGTEAVSKFAAAVGTNYRVTGWLMKYRSAETRSTT